MADVSKDPQPYMDGGTGAYPPPPESVTVESPVDLEPTGAVEGPPAEVTVESPAGEDVTKSTGAVDGPPAEQTIYQWPAQAPPDTKQIKASDIKDKAVKAPKSTS